MARTISFSAPEHIDDTVDGFRRRARVQSSEHQVAGFRSGERQNDRFRSRISPTSTTSGSSRKADLSASVTRECRDALRAD